MRRLIALTALVLVWTPTAMAQSTIPDPDFPRLYAETRGFSLGKPSSITFTPDGKTILFRRSGPKSFENDLFAFDIATGKERTVLSAEMLLGDDDEVLSDAEKARRERMRMTARGISSFRLSKDGTKLLTVLSGTLYVVDRETSSVAEIPSRGGYPIAPRFSPDGTKIAVVRDRDLIVHTLDGEERRLTETDSDDISYGLSEFIAQEEMGRMEGFWWSPDSTQLVVQRTDTSPVERLHIADAVNPEREPQSRPYPRAGTENAVVTLGMVSATGGDTTWIEWDREAYPYLVNVRWPKKGPLCVLVQNRRQTEMLLLGVDPDSGTTRLIHREFDAAWLNIDQDMPRWLPDGSGFLWATDRNGARQLELRSVTGELVRELTDVELGFRGLVSLHEDGSAAIVRASKNPTETHVYRVDLLETTAPMRLTSDAGNHSMSFANDHGAYVHHSASLDGDTAYRVVRADGTEAGELASLAADAPFDANVELTRVGSDPSMHVAIIRPRNFDSARRYPVIESVYGGPSGPMVTQDRSRYRGDQWLADHGYIVVRIDGRGTRYRGREWSRAIKDDFVGVPLADHVAALKALGDRYSEMDMGRVGIHGWSFGGYFSAMAVMRYPEVYHAAIAGAPVVDWRDYDTHYTERFIGTPQDDTAAYDVSNVLTYAAQLRRPLLLIHGTTDDNVYFMHSLKLSAALYAEGIDHEFLPLSNFTHMVADPRVAARRVELTARFFHRHLLGGADEASAAQ